MSKCKSIKRYTFLIILTFVLCCSLIAIGACNRKRKPEHEHRYVENVTPATCTVDGLTTYSCECGDSYNQVIPATGHSLKFVVVDGGSEHYQKCENCDYATEKTSHSYDIVLSDNPSTCAQKGSETLGCECGATTNRELPLADHALQYASDKSQHWQECKNCDYATETVNHSHDKLIENIPSTCTVRGSKTNECVCGDQVVEELPLAAHKYTKVVYDADGHFNVCSVCGTPDPDYVKQQHQYSRTIITELTCTQDEKTKFSCDCGYTYTEITQQATGHEPDKTQFTKRTPSGHFYECVNCGIEFSEQHESIDVDCSNGYNREATCYQTGHQDKKCTVCELVYETATPKTDEHNYSTEWTSNGTHHWHACLNGDGKCTVKGQETMHTFETVRQEPTCTEVGFERKVCICGEIQSNKTLSKVAHDYEETVLIQASCIQTGEVKKVCRVCQDTVIETVAQLKHDWTLWDCDENQHWHLCANCKTVQDSKGNHNFRKTETVNATCTVDGYELYVCTACEYESRKTLPAHHNYYSIDEGRIDPTCKEYGSHIEICSVCDNRITVVDESLGYADHDVVYHGKKEATDDTDGNIAYWQCRVCDKYFSSHNCEKELTEDEVFIRAPKTVIVETIAELKEYASDVSSADYYQITLMVVLVDSTELMFTDGDDYIFLTVDSNVYNLETINEDDIVTVKGFMIAETNGDVTLLNAKIISVDNGDPDLVDLIFSVSGDLDYVVLSAFSDMGDEWNIVNYGFITNLYNFNCLLVEDNLTLTYYNYQGVIIRSLVINGKSYTMSDGQLTLSVTKDLYIEIEFSKYDTNNVTLEEIDTSYNASVTVNPYLSYRYVNGSSSGSIVKDSFLRFYLENAYITRITIEFEEYNLTDVANNIISVGKDEPHKNAISYTLKGTTATLIFSKSDSFTFLEYSANVSQARIISIKIEYATSNT